MAFIEGIIDHYNYRNISPYEKSILNCWQDDGFGNLINTWYDDSYRMAGMFWESNSVVEY